MTLRCGRFLISLLILLVATSSQGALEKTDLKSLREILTRYQKSPLVEVKLEKKVTSEILGREKVQQGKASLAPQRFRLEISEPDKSLIVYDGQTLWNVQYPQAGDSTGPQVIRAKLNAKTQSQVLLGDLLVGQGLFEKFELTGTKRDEKQLEISAVPKKRDLPVQDLKFRLLLKDKVIEAIEYKDDLGNHTVMNLSGTEFKKKKNAKLFQYKPEKGAQVTDL